MKDKGFSRWVLAAAAAFIMAAPAYAHYSAPRGWYLEANYGLANLQDRTYVAGVSEFGNPKGGNLIVGYKYNPYVSAEFGYTRFTDIKLRNTAGTKIATDNHQAMHLAVKGLVPTKFGIEPFAKLGVARVKSDIDIIETSDASAVGLTGKTSSKLGAYFGAGMQYNYSPMTAIIAQWSRAKGNSKTGTLDLYTLGLAIIFD